MPQIANKGVATDRPGWAVKINGEDLPPEVQLKGFTVHQEINRIPWARLNFFDGRPAIRDFKTSNLDNFQPGNKLEISAGYGGQLFIIFSGLIVKHGIKIRQDQASVLSIEAKDKTVLLSLDRKNAIFHDQTDSDIIRNILEKYRSKGGGIQADLASTSVTHKELVQYFATDWDFILCRAEANGMVVQVEEGKLSMKATDLDTQSAPDLSLQYGADLFEFEAEMDARTQAETFAASSWDLQELEPAKKEQGADTQKLQGNLSGQQLGQALKGKQLSWQHAGNLSAEELAVWARAAAAKSALARIRGRVSFKGNSNVKTGQVLELKGVGERFNGKAYITGVRQEMETGSWQTHVQFGGTPRWFSQHHDIRQPPAAGLVPAVGGLQTALVHQLEQDPDGQFRIKVRLPLVDSDVQGIWARLATLDAGANRGSFFLPEIGDEVVVGFLQEDPRFPVVLGMLHSSKKSAPLQAQDSNPEKGFVTREQMKLVFNDQNKDIELSTPKGKKLLLSENDDTLTIQDEKGNEIKFSAEGLSMTSNGNISLKADGGEVRIEGSTINLSADMQLKVEGSAGVELSSSGETVVKGSMVRIN